MRGHGKRQPDVHARGIMLYGRVNEFFEFRERHDFIKLARDLALAHPQDSAGEERVFPPGEFRMEPRADFQQRPDAPVNFRPSRRRARDTGQDFQERRLARPIPPDQAKYFSFFHFQRNVLQRPESLLLLAPKRRKGRAQELLQGVAQAGVPLKPAPVPLPQPFPVYHRLIHFPKPLLFSPLNLLLSPCQILLKCYNITVNYAPQFRFSRPLQRSSSASTDHEPQSSGSLSSLESALP